MKRLFALMLLAVGFASSAHADYIATSWSDSLDFGGKKLSAGQSYSYTHSILDNGFTPTVDKIKDFTLSVNLAGGGWDTALVYLPDSWWAGDVFAYDFGASGNDHGGWSILGLLQLNTLGTLTVTITSVWGDFNLLGSTLNANGWSKGGSTSVPEPGALGLLGLGLLGMAVSMRRRKATR